MAAFWRELRRPSCSCDDDRRVAAARSCGPITAKLQFGSQQHIVCDDLTYLNRKSDHDALTSMRPLGNSFASLLLILRSSE